MEGSRYVSERVEVDITHSAVTDYLGILDKELELLASVMSGEWRSVFWAALTGSASLWVVTRG